MPVIELKQIRAFLAVAQYSSFSKAAESTFFTQSALSKQVAALETALGARLFERDKHSVRLTDAGSAFLPVARDLLDRAEHATRLLDAMEGESGPVTTVRLVYEAGVLEEPFLKTVLARCVAAFLRERPQVRVDLYRQTPEGLERGIRSGEYDLGLSVQDLPPEHVFLDREVRGTLLRALPLVIALPAGAAEAGLPPRGPMNVLIRENDYRAVSQTLQIFPSYDIQPKFRYCGCQLNILVGVQTGQGATLLPAEMAAYLDPAQVALVPVDPEVSSSYLCAEWAAAAENPCLAPLLAALQQSFAR